MGDLLGTSGIAGVGLDIDSALRLVSLVKSGPLGWLYIKL